MFQSVEELNEAVRSHRAQCALTRTELAVLDVLAQYSCVEPGVSYLRKSKIAEAIGKSRRTVIRACNRLEELGIIAQYKRMRQTGDRRQTSNKIVILPAASKTPVTPECHTEKAPSKNSNFNNTIATNGALKRSIPAQLYAALSPYFNDVEMYKAVGLLYRAKASVDRAITFEDHAGAFIDAFKSVVFSYKRGKVRSLYGCLYGAWRAVATEIKRRATFNNTGIFYDWLA
ncbi:helix-turn-helix domain-containing protein [Heyndrickxia ginsengihumi]|uniref:helix-turn-helix domain-containing protein n=1 Tax=Heyndrickxia ginsengihumi TaxID=363870 RepID=UPI003D2385B7